MSQLKYITNSRGGLNLISNGYLYNRCAGSAKTVFWACHLRNSKKKKCPGKAKTWDDQFCCYCNHNHPVDKNLLEVELFKHSLKRMCIRRPDISASKLVAEWLLGLLGLLVFIRGY